MALVHCPTPYSLRDGLSKSALIYIIIIVNLTDCLLYETTTTDPTDTSTEKAGPD
jgi:hypothetical protein